MRGCRQYCADCVLLDFLNRWRDGHACGSEDRAASPLDFAPQQELLSLVLDVYVLQGLQVVKDLGPLEFVTLERQAVC